MRTKNIDEEESGGRNSDKTLVSIYSGDRV